MLGGKIAGERRVGTLGVAILATTALFAGASCSSSRGSADGNRYGGFAAGTLPESGGTACASKEAEAIPGARPVDIIFVIDNSQSMSEEIAEVEEQINVNFANLISKTDYRVIMLSSHGAHGAANPTQKICVKAPLSGSTCSPIPKLPSETERFFQHDTIISSQDTLCQVLTTYHAPDSDNTHPQGWATLLRPHAFKIFTVITDDQVAAGPCAGWPRFDDRFDDQVSSKTLAQTFETALFALDPVQFGNTSRRNYTWHSIVGVAPFDASDTSKPYPPSAALVSKTCTPSAVAPGLGYQALSQLTGGLRYPTCGLDYTTIFKAMAKGVIDNAVLACEYSLPPNPAGGTIDPETAVVRYTSGTTVTDFERVDDESQCAPGKFFLADKRIKLCADTCKTVQDDAAAQVKILFGCAVNAK